MMSRVTAARCVLALFAMLAVWPACGQEAKSKDSKSATRLPPARKTYLGRTIAPVMSFHGAPWLIRPERQREENCKQLLSVMKLKPGQVVCDMGCGNGFYSLQMAKLVGEKGKVLAVDIQPEMLSLLNKRLKTAGIKNVKPILGTPIDPKLPAGGVDMILLVDVYHEFTYPERMLRAMRKSLKPDGQLCLVEFRLEDPAVPIKLLHKMSKKQILKEFPANGYRLVRQYDKLPCQHVMFFGRMDQAKSK